MLTCCNTQPTTKTTSFYFKPNKKQHHTVITITTHKRHCNNCINDSLKVKDCLPLSQVDSIDTARVVEVKERTPSSIISLTPRPDIIKKIEKQNVFGRC